MKRFQFTLEAVRTVRQQAEQRAWLNYARLVRRHQQEEQRLRQAEQDARAAWHEARERMGSGIAGLELERLSAYARLAEQRRRNCAAAVAASHRALEEGMRQCREARQHCEVVEIYYRKQLGNYQRAEFLEDQKLLDEMGQRGGLRRAGLSVKDESNP